MRRIRAFAMFALVLAAVPPAPRARAGPAPMLFRPRVADPREAQNRFRFASFTEDIRYGTDVADSTSVGGVDQDVRGVGFGVTAGHTLRGPTWSHLGRMRGPGRAWQLAAPLAIDASFDRVGADFLNVTDYQFGAGIDVLWNGAGDAIAGIPDFGRPVFTTRTALLHRSSHVSDDYLGRAGFGRNQEGLAEAGALSPRPPVKRAVLSYEVLETAASVEWAPRAGGDATLRAYLGGEWKLGLSGIRPRRFRSPATSFGLELRGAGNRADVGAGPIARAVNRALHTDALASSWLAAIDLRLARPFDFAACDDPAGRDERWTPTLWTDCPYGREGRYAGTWHGMVALSLLDAAARNAARGGGRVGHETLIALEWSRGHSTHGMFLDRRRREHPRWYVAPSLIHHF